MYQGGEDWSELGQKFSHAMEGHTPDEALTACAEVIASLPDFRDGHAKSVTLLAELARRAVAILTY